MAEGPPDDAVLAAGHLAGHRERCRLDVGDPGEVQRVLDQLAGRDHLIVSLLYGAGLRIAECCQLRIKDICIERLELSIRGGKGGHARPTVLPRAVLDALRAAQQVETDPYTKPVLDELVE